MVAPHQGYMINVGQRFWIGIQGVCLAVIGPELPSDLAEAKMRRAFTCQCEIARYNHVLLIYNANILCNSLNWYYDNIIRWDDRHSTLLSKSSIEYLNVITRAFGMALVYSEVHRRSLLYLVCSSSEVQLIAECIVRACDPIGRIYRNLFSFRCILQSFVAFSEVWQSDEVRYFLHRLVKGIKIAIY